jgi:proteic killer suppression protein
MVDYAARLSDLGSPPGNELEKLERERKGQHSIRINRQYRVCFVWIGDGAADVEITDYH